MPIVFIDAGGTEGRITDDWSVVYDGPEPVEAFVDGVVDEAATDAAAIEEVLATIEDELDLEWVLHDEG